MNSDNLYQKLVDLYAGDELPQELMDELEQAALTQPGLAWEMQTLRTVVRQLHAIPAPPEMEASLENVLAKLRQEGVPIKEDEPKVVYLQHYLPLGG